MKPLGTVEEILHAASLRRTPVRAGVIEVLRRAPRPLGAVEILGELPPSTDTVTVYRTLNTLTRKKLLHRVRSEDRVWRYALGRQDPPAQHQHPHFVCEECGKVECLREAAIPRNFLASLHVAPDYRVNYPEVILHGCCPRCRE
jgi:Fe2+ or Zn2+ uptake regulation protein